MEENIKTNQSNNFNPTKKRTFTETEQTAGSYNVGMKKNKKSLPKNLVNQVNKHLNEVNQNLNLENIEQENLMAKTTGKGRVKNSKNDKVKIIFLGGIGEIGKNITAIEYGNDMIILVLVMVVIGIATLHLNLWDCISDLLTYF